MLLDASFYLKFWAETVVTDPYIINRLPTKNFQQSPEEIWSSTRIVNIFEYLDAERWHMSRKNNKPNFNRKPDHLFLSGIVHQLKDIVFMIRSAENFTSIEMSSFLRS